MHKKKLLVILSFVLHALLFFVFFPISGDKSTAFTLIPILVVSYFLGIRIGLISALLLMPINMLYFYILGVSGLQVYISSLPGAIGSFILVFIAGYTGRLQRKNELQVEQLRKEQRDRIKAEEELFRTQKQLQENLYSRASDRAVNESKMEITDIAYKEIAENAADIIYLTDLNGKITYVNKAGLDTSGYSSEELHKLAYDDLVLPSYKKITKYFYFKQSIQNKQTAFFEVPILTKQGSLIWLAQNSSLIYKDETLAGFGIIARDITEKKNTDLALREKEERLEQITQSANDAIITTDSNYIIIQWNKAAEKIYGYSEAEIIGKPITILMSEEDIQLCKSKIRRNSPDYDFSKTFERTAKRKDGSLFPIEISITDWERENEIFRTHIIRDISERKESEKKLIQSEMDYRLLFMSVHEPILVLRPEDEVILEANDKACEVYGFERSEFIGMSLKKVSVNIAKGEEKITETLTAGRLINFETSQLRKDGKLLIFEVNASIIEYKGQQAILSINRNITEKLETQREIRLLLAAIDNTSEMISLHDLENRLIFANKSFLNTFGYTEEEVIGKMPYLLSKEKKVPGTDDLILKVSKGENWSGTIFAQKKNGEDFPAAISTTFVTDPGTNSRAVVSVSRDITNEIKSNEKLKESEEQYRILFENNPLPVIVCEHDSSKIIAVNKSAVKCYGYTYEEFLNMNSNDLVSSTSTDLIGQHLRFYETDNSKIYQTHIKKNGSNFSVEVSTHILNINGNLAVINMINDMSLRLKFEKEIIRQRDRAQKYMDISPVLMCVLDTAGNVVLMNDTGCSIIGYNEMEVRGENWVKLCFKPEHQSSMKHILQQMMNGEIGSFDYFENTIVTRDGEEKILAFHNTIIIEEDYGVSGILFSGEDITDRKNNEKVINDYKNHLELLVSERTSRLQELNSQLFLEYKKLSEADEQIQNQYEFFKTLINTIPLPVFIRDKNRNFIECNAAFENFYGIEKKTLINRSIADVLPGELYNQFNLKDKELFEGLPEQHFEIDVVDKNGSMYEVIIYQAPFYKKDGTADGYVAVMLDITSQKILQRETARSLEKEKELNELKSGFISMASHEFRTPLTTILASADLLEIMGPKWDDEKYKKHLVKIQNAVTYMTELIDDVLLINKAETGRMKFTPALVNVADLIKETVDNFKVIAGGNINFDVVYSPEKDLYMLDLKLFTQIITNLVSNAVKYSPGGGEIKIKAIESGTVLLLEISDQGIGIHPDDLKFLFQPFHRGKNIEGIAGTGLGLSIVQKAVEMHNGQIFVNSTPDKGTSFTILFPIVGNQE
jgi:PAS domain S-box-containing protein